ncbi:MAG: hypothetical protein JWQ09_4439 [Segetibacter sp.]|nr:hypothetical protein [Segetibacter sp.]
MLIRYTPFYTPAREMRILFLILLVSSAYSATAQHASISDSAALIAAKLYPDHAIDLLNVSTISFYKPPNRRVNFGLTGNEYHYILLKLSTKTPEKEQYLSIDNTSIDTIKIYRILIAKKAELLYEGGDLMVYKNKIYNWHTVPIEIGTSPTFYLVALKAAHENINVVYEILGRDQLHVKYQSYDRLVCFYIGIICLIFPIILGALFLFRKKELAAYLCYIVCFSGWVLAHYGRLFPLLYPQFPVINKIIKPVSSVGACFFLLMVLQVIFKQSLLRQRWLQRITRWMISGLGFVLCLMLLFLLPNLDVRVNYFLVVLWHVGLIASILLVIYIPVIFFKTSLTARIFSAAMFAVSVSASVQLIATAGLIDSFFINEHGLTVGSLLEITIMAFGLFFSLLEEMRHKERQVLALEQEQTETLKKLVSVQDQERKRIAADLHDNIGPLLAALKINFGRLVHNKDPALLSGVVSKTESIIDDSIAEIRNVAHNLMPRVYPQMVL